MLDATVHLECAVSSVVAKQRDQFTFWLSKTFQVSSEFFKKILADTSVSLALLSKVLVAQNTSRNARTRLLKATYSGSIEQNAAHSPILLASTTDMEPTPPATTRQFQANAESISCDVCGHPFLPGTEPNISRKGSGHRATRKSRTKTMLVYQQQAVLYMCTIQKDSHISLDKGHTAKRRLWLWWRSQRRLQRRRKNWWKTDVKKKKTEHLPLHTPNSVSIGRSPTKWTSASYGMFA